MPLDPIPAPDAPWLTLAAVFVGVAIVGVWRVWPARHRLRQIALAVPRKRDAALTLVLLALPPLLSLPFFGDFTGIIDFRHTTVLPAAARHALLEHGELPLWMPYISGGFSHVGAMESGFLFPTFVLTLLFDVFVAALIEYVLFTVIGGVGLVLLSRQLGASLGAARVAGLAFTASNTMPVYLAGGWMMHFTMAFIPLALWLWLRSGTSRRAELALAALLCLMLLRGGMYPLAYAVMALGGLALLDALHGRSGAPLLRLARVGLGAGLLGAVKLLPVLTVGDLGSPRAELGFCFTAKGLLVGLTTWRIPGSAFEGCGVIGPLALGLCALGIAVHVRQLAPLLAVAAFFGLYALGSHVVPGQLGGPDGMHACPSGPSLAGLVGQLPGLGALWNPSRALVPLGLLLLVPMALGLDALTAVLAERWQRLRRGLLPLLAVAVTVPGALDAARYLEETLRPLDLPGPASPRPPFTQHLACATDRDARDVHRTDAYCPLLERGAVRVTNLAFHPTAAGLRVVEDPTYLGEAWLVGAGDARTVGWSPNRVEVAVTGAAPERLVLNQNFRPGWTAEGPAVTGPVEPRDGLLSVAVSGPGRLTLTYAPWSAPVGAAVSLGAWLLAGLWLWRARQSAVNPSSRHSLGTKPSTP